MQGYGYDYGYNWGSLTTLVDFPIQNFQDPSGGPLANGYVLLTLSTDCMAPSGLMSSLSPVKLQLDSNGNVVPGPVFWHTSALTPNNSTYVLRAFRANGQRVAGPLSITI